MDHVAGCLDGELLMTYKEPQQFFSIAGKDEVTGDIIVKVVNASANPYQTSISLNGVPGLQSTGELISLRAASVFEISFKPYSINVLRLQTK